MISPYEMRLSLNVLEHLGLNLYSNIPAVLAEVVANAWDADATLVTIVLDTARQSITITDDGHGMSEADLNDRFLMIGYRRRANQGALTPKYQRHVMGRKGIGKLSLFAIANEIEVRSAKRSGRGRSFRIARAGLILRTADVESQIAAGQTSYRPAPIAPTSIGLERGTELRLRQLRLNLGAATEVALRRRLARRFSIIGPSNRFEVQINGRAIGVGDRDYFPKVEYLWSIGRVDDTYERLCTNAKKAERISGIIDPTTGLEVTGWIGTLDEQRGVDDENTAVTILAWGKLVQEDILSDIRAGGIYTKYLMGEIRADFVDSDGQPDIATSDRQRLKETDPRYQALRNFVRTDLLRRVENAWGQWRKEDALGKALEHPVVTEWYETLDAGSQSFAKDLFGRIGSFPKQDDDARRELYRYGILGFEKLKFQKLLIRTGELGDRLEVDALRGLVLSIDDLEAAEYHQIVRGRLGVIESFAGLVDANAKERALQAFLFDHLWLLHPSWERASTNARIEQSVMREFRKVTDRLSPDERAGRIDIRYRTAAGTNIVIELKRYGTKTTVWDLSEQLNKYGSALAKVLREKYPNEPQEIRLIAVVGGPPTGADLKTVTDVLRTIGASWITYDALIQESQESYADYIAANDRLSRIANILERALMARGLSARQPRRRPQRDARPRASSEAARSRMLAVRRSGTAPEIAWASVLSSADVAVEAQVTLDFVPRRRLDFVIMSSRVAISIDGCFWHGCPEHGSSPKANSKWWQAKIEANRRRDIDTENKLRAHGWTILRFWEHTDPKEAVREVMQAVDAGPVPRTS